jgi:hypothetical protein
MSTNADIGIIYENGHVDVIYLHWDGHRTSAGKTLLEHYKTDAKIRRLILLGSLSELGEEIGEKHDFDWIRACGTDNYMNDPRYKMCTAYGRDRGEDVVIRHFPSVNQAKSRLTGEYSYLYDVRKGYWTHRLNRRSNFRKLTEKVCKRD